MNILVTLDEHYLNPLTVMLKSLAVNNPAETDVYVMSRSLTKEHIAYVEKRLKAPNVRLILCRVEGDLAVNAPTSSRYPLEIYDRLFAARYLPDSLSKILYLDPDLVILKSLKNLWELTMEGQFYAAASHVGKVGEVFNSVRVEADGIVPYINSGVLLMNLEALRREQNPKEVLDYIEDHRDSLMLPDQDVITALYGERVILLDPYIYNMTERLLAKEMLTPGSEIDPEWVSEHSAIVHYIGRNKPWKNHYRGSLKYLYDQYAEMVFKS